MKARSIVALLVLAGALAAKGWSIKLFPPPPAQFTIYQMWSCQITTPEKETHEIKLHGFIERNGKKIGDATGTPIELRPGLNRITYRDLKGYEKAWWDKKYEELARRGRPLPPGNYYYCIEVIDPKTRGVLAKDCKEVNIKKVSKIRLISPKDGAVIRERFPTFVWTPVTPPVKGVTYNLLIAEVPKGMTPEEAIKRPKPLFEKKRITKTSLTYPPSATKLEMGKRYAWQVIAVSEGHEVAKSDIRSFDYAPRQPTIPISIEGEETRIKRQLWIPPGSKTKKNKDGSLTVEVPIDYRLMYISPASGIIKLAPHQKPDGSVTFRCKCKGTPVGGIHCEVAVYDKNGWVKVTCANVGCEGTCELISSSSGQMPSSPEQIPMGFVNLKKGIEFCTEKELHSLPNAFPAMFQCRETKKLLNDFVGEIYGDKEIPKPEISEDSSTIKAPKGYVFAPVNFCGRAAAMLVPMAAAPDGNGCGCEITCDCVSGQIGSGCTPVFTLSSVFCEPETGCDECRIHIGGTIHPETPSQVKEPKKFKPK